MIEVDGLERVVGNLELFQPWQAELRKVQLWEVVFVFWLNVQNREGLSECPPCESLESMDHILLECEAPGQRTVWEEMRALWSRTGLEWPEINLGIIMGCALVKIRDQSGKPRAGESRLFRILTSESAFLIWKIRNERRIQNQDDPEKHAIEQEIIARWRAQIEKRLRIDAQMTSRYETQSLYSLLSAPTGWAARNEPTLTEPRW